jgi:hypothetical protein
MRTGLSQMLSSSSSSTFHAKASSSLFAVDSFSAASTMLSYLQTIANTNSGPLPFSYFKQNYAWLARVFKRMLIHRELYITDYVALDRKEPGASGKIGCAFLLCNSPVTNALPLNSMQEFNPAALSIIVHAVPELGFGECGEVYKSNYEVIITLRDEEALSSQLEKSDSKNPLYLFDFQIIATTEKVIKICDKSLHPPVYEWQANSAFNFLCNPLSKVYLTLYERQAFFVMPWLAGDKLGRYIEQQKRDFHCENINAMSLLTIAIKIAEKLKIAHSLGIIHGDFQPSNILIDIIEGNIIIHLLDFGQSRIN